MSDGPDPRELVAAMRDLVVASRPGRYDALLGRYVIDVASGRAERVADPPLWSVGDPPWSLLRVDADQGGVWIAPVGTVPPIDWIRDTRHYPSGW